jgi:hypothetical protein
MAHGGHGGGLDQRRRVLGGAGYPFTPGITSDSVRTSTVPTIVKLTSRFRKSGESQIRGSPGRWGARSAYVDSVGHGKKDDDGYRNGVEVLLMLNSAIYGEEGVERVSGGVAQEFSVGYA